MFPWTVYDAWADIWLEVWMEHVVEVWCDFINELVRNLMPTASVLLDYI